MFRWFTATMVLASVTCAQELTPVPPALLNGQELVLAEQNCAVTSPSQFWAWMQAPTRESGTLRVLTWACVHPQEARRFLVAVTEGAVIATESAAREYADGVCLATRNSTGLELTTLEAAAVPLPGSSWRLEFRGTQAGSPLRHVIYVASTDRTYTITYQAPATTWQDGGAEFASFVSSFRLLGPVQAPPEAPKAVGSKSWAVVAIGGYAFGALGVVALGVGAGLRRSRPAHAKTAVVVGAALLGLAVILPAILVGPTLATGRSATQTGGAYVRVLFTTVALGLLPAGALAIVLRRSMTQPEMPSGERESGPPVSPW